MSPEALDLYLAKAEAANFPELTAARLQSKSSGQTKSGTFRSSGERPPEKRVITQW